ncbi:phosphoglycerate mutase [Defluviimonas sp. 20V17]|uniref:Broad specificity phosphatase PhoE n=1 Tax=Allgaiera indica TaxID=765699 RepID=A0AAN4UUD7_9RHOB|nr:histidine phosphatase family protein [Allgaiera indica]KDB05223.1 phosphoglycerate mutase [Defluviimonas sp. 20V17]GHE04964.1 fructose 2,6-bisphosphatase [Allgaiera indica]SDX60324.1 Broad specificity phosphatase PhoE [Allgaiera indica]
MRELVLLRHAQASFGAADYDVLSDLGHDQSLALGEALAAQGLRPDHLWIGAQRRHRETLEGVARGLGLDPAQARIHPGLNEFDFTGLLNARYRDRARPVGLHDDRATHFRELRDTVLAWQRDEIEDPPEPWQAFAARVRDARRAMLAAEGTTLAVSSGGAIGRMVAEVLEAPEAQMIHLQLQIRNCAVARFIGGHSRDYLAGFNETPHITAQTAHLLTYS